MKQCVTYREYKMILDDLRKQTNILSEGSTFNYEGKITKYYYFIKCSMFKTLPEFLANINKDYGRHIDISEDFNTEGIITFYIRGLGKELA